MGLLKISRYRVIERYLARAVDLISGISGIVGHVYTFTAKRFVFGGKILDDDWWLLTGE